MYGRFRAGCSQRPIRCILQIQGSFSNVRPRTRAYRIQEGKSIPLNALGLGFVFTARDLASGTINRLNRNFVTMDKTSRTAAERINQSFKMLGAGIATMVPGVLGLAAGFGLAARAGTFTQSLTDVGSISRATAADLQLLEQTAIDVALRTQFSPDEAVGGLRTLAQAGLNARESMDLLEPSLELAQAALGQLSVEDTTGLAISAMRGFGVATEGVGTAFDKMLRTVQSFRLDAADLPLGLGIITRGAQRMSQSLDTSLISFGLVRNVIPTLERAATSATVVMERLADPKRQAKFKKAFGVDVVDRSTGQFKDLLDIAVAAIPAFEGMTEAQRGAAATAIFGNRAAGGFSIILQQLMQGVKGADGVIRKGADAVAFLRGEMATAGGTTKEFGEKRLATFRGQLQLLRGQIEGFIVAIGKPFEKAFLPFVTSIRENFGAFVTAISRMPESVKVAMAKIVLAGSLFLVVVGFIVATKAAIGLLIPAFKFLRVAILGSFGGLAGFLAFFVALPLAVVAVKKAMEENIFGLGDKLRAFSSGFVAGFRDGMAQVGMVIKTVATFVSDLIFAFEGLLSGFKQNREAASGWVGVGISIGELLPKLIFGFVAWKAATVALTVAKTVLIGRIGLLRAITIAWRVIVIAITALQWLWNFATSAGARANLFLGASLVFARLKQLALTPVTKAAAAAQMLFARSSNIAAASSSFLGGKLGFLRGGFARLAGSLIGRAGLVGAAGAAGFAIGKLLDDWLGISDKIAGIEHPKTEAEANKLGRTLKRGAPPLPTEKRDASDLGISVAELRRRKEMGLPTDTEAGLSDLPETRGPVVPFAAPEPARPAVAERAAAVRGAGAGTDIERLVAGLSTEQSSNHRDLIRAIEGIEINTNLKIGEDVIARAVRRGLRGVENDEGIPTGLEEDF